MNLRNLNWPLMAVSLVVTLGIMLGMTYVVRQSTESAPLRKFYATHPEVRHADIQRDGDRYDITLTLGPVSDFRQAYSALDAGTKAVLKDSKSYKLNIADGRNQALVDDYYQLHFGLQSGIATGDFNKMASDFEARSKALGLDRSKVWVDSNRLYVQLEGHGGYLYEVLPRLNQPAQTVEGGSAA